MIDQPRSSVPEKREQRRSSSDKSETSRDDNNQKKGPAGALDIIAMVRSLQRAAGLADCFRTGNADCDIIECDWRTYCLGTPDRKKRH